MKAFEIGGMDINIEQLRAEIAAIDDTVRFIITEPKTITPGLSVDDDTPATPITIPAQFRVTRVTGADKDISDILAQVKAAVLSHSPAETDREKRVRLKREALSSDLNANSVISDIKARLTALEGR